MEQKLLERILDVGRHLAEIGEIDLLSRKVIDETVSVLEAEQCYLALSQADGSLQIFAQREQEDASGQDAGDHVATGVLRHVLNTNQPLVWPTFAEDGRASKLDGMAIPGTCSLMCAPLVSRGDVIGALCVENRTLPSRFGANDLEPLVLLANIVAANIVSARLRAELEKRLEERTAELLAANEQLKRQNDQLELEVAERKRAEEAEHRQRILAEALCQTGAKLSSTLDYDKVLDLILTQVRLVLQYDTVNIMSVENGVVRTVRWRGYEQRGGSEYIASLRFRIDERPTMVKIRESGRPLIIPTVEGSDLWVAEPHGSWIRSYIGVPISFHGNVIGFLNVNSATPGFFQDSDAERLLAFADQAAVAMENARLFESLTQQGQQLRVLAARLAQAEEAERKRLARELHDQAGQNLTALSANLEIVRMLFAECTSTIGTESDRVIDQLYERLHDASALVRETTERIRNVMEYLRPPALEERGLIDALEWYGIEFSSRTGVVVDVDSRGAATKRPNAAVETAFFRIAQEALTNVARHANASRAQVTISLEQDTLTMIVADNGVGFTRPHARPGERQHWGLLSMAERAQAVGGRCRAESAPGEGTRVIVEVSL